MLSWLTRPESLAAATALGVMMAAAPASGETTPAAGREASPLAPAPPSPAAPLAAPATDPPPLPSPAQAALASTGAAAKPTDSLAADSRPTEATQETPLYDPHARNTARTIGWISIAIGAEAAVVAVVTSAMALHEKGVRDDNCNAAKVCTRTGLDANATLGTLFGWNTASWIVAVAGLGVGTVLVLTNRPIKNDQVALTLAPAPGGAALGIAGRF